MDKLRKAAEMALPLLIAYQDYTNDSRIANECGEVIKALEAELAKPEQEPVVWVSLIQEAQAIVEGKYLFKRFIDGTPLSNDIAVWMTEFALKYAAPPKQEWFGLTQSEIEEIYMRNTKEGGVCNGLSIALEVQHMLKEKNAPSN